MADEADQVKHKYCTVYVSNSTGSTDVEVKLGLVVGESQTKPVLNLRQILLEQDPGTLFFFDRVRSGNTQVY